MFQLNDKLQASLVVIILTSYLLYDQKPALMFHPDGRFKQFGLSQDETICPFLLVITIIGFTCYYYLLIKEGKYV